MLPSQPSPAAAAPFGWKSAPTPSDPDHVCILAGWDVLNITSFACEELSRWTKGHSRIVTMNHSVKDSFLALWKAWEKAGVLAALQPAIWSGAYNPRFKRGVPHDQNPSHLSNHCAGTAFDICAQRYPLGSAVPATDPIRHLAEIAKTHGWRWGGDFIHRVDGMHFEAESSPFL